MHSQCTNDEEKLKAIREQMSATTAVHYLNNGTNGPLPRVAVAAMKNEIEKEHTNGRYRPLIRDLYANMDVVKKYLREMLGASDAEIALTESTTEGMNIIYWGLPWQPGDEVVTTNMEHPAGLAPLTLVKSRYEIVVKYVDVAYGDIYDEDRFLLEQVGMYLITSRIPHLARYVRKLIGDLSGVELVTPEGKEAGFIHFHVKGRKPIQLCHLLSARKFMIRCVPQPHLPVPARISTGFYNTEEELEIFAQALSEVIH